MKRVVTNVIIAVAMMLVGTVSAAKQPSAAAVYPSGTLMVSTWNGLVQEWDTSTTPPTFVKLLDTGMGAGSTAGSVFNVAGDFFVAGFCPFLLHHKPLPLSQTH